MFRFWYPYAGFADAQKRLCHFANQTVGPDCGVSFSDGLQIAALRLPGAGSGGSAVWLNVLARHVALPPTSRAAPGERFGSLGAWFERILAIEGRAEIDGAEAQMATARALEQAAYTDAWLPTHEFLLRHKLAVDTAGVALDVVGVIAGGIFLVTVAPELVAVGTVAAVAGLVTGTFGAIGAVALAYVDGTSYLAEVFGDDVSAHQYEDETSNQWIRIAATIMLLPVVLVGGTRSLLEIGKLGQEADEASALATSSRDGADAARARAAEIRHPDRHPGPLNRRLHRANVLAQAALRQSRMAEEATARLLMVAGRDIGVFQGSTLAGTALLTAVPPGVVLTDEQRRRDEEYERSLTPAGGMPKDIRLEMRVTSHMRDLP